MDPWKSWAIVGVVGAGAAYYYTQSGKSKRGRTQSAVSADSSQRRGLSSKNDNKDTRKKKGKSKNPDASDQASSDFAETSAVPVKTSSTDGAKKRKGAKQQPSQLAQSSAVDVSNGASVDSPADEAEDEAMSNREFAMQLSGLKTGTSLKKPDTVNKENKKTKKQGKSTEMPPEATNGSVLKPNEIPYAQEPSTASSTTGADADDDLSVPSPEIHATQATTPSSANISDMLEAPAKGPSILRLTEPTNQQPARQPKQQKPKPEPETKKQRQNRQKNEEKKALRGEAEKERRILLEKQRRTAREAEGRPAKNGLSSSKAPTTSAWDRSTTSADGPTANIAAALPAKNDGPLLDTFEEDRSFLGDAPQGNDGAPNTVVDEQVRSVNGDDSINQGMQGKAETNGTSQRPLENGVLSEEEQIRLVNEMDSDDTWKTVSKGKGKKKPATGSSADISKQDPPGSSQGTLEMDDRKPLSTITNSSSRNESNASSLNAQISSSIDGTKPSTTAAVSQPTTESRGDESLHNSEISRADTGKPEDPRIRFPHLDFEGGTFHQDDINDKGVSKYFKGKLLPDGRPDYNDPDYGQYWVPGMSVDQVYRPHYKHPGFRKDGVTVKETYQTIDHSVWTRENIQDHPDYDSAWPYALTGHPMDSDWAGDWDPSEIEEANAKRPEQEVTEKSEQKAHRRRDNGQDDQPTLGC